MCKCKCKRKCTAQSVYTYCTYTDDVLYVIQNIHLLNSFTHFGLFINRNNQLSYFFIKFCILLLKDQKKKNKKIIIPICKIYIIGKTFFQFDKKRGKLLSIENITYTCKIM